MTEPISPPGTPTPAPPPPYPHPEPPVPCETPAEPIDPHEDEDELA